MGDSKEANKYFVKSAKINKVPLEEKEIETYLDHQVWLCYILSVYSGDRRPCTPPQATM